VIACPTAPNIVGEAVVVSDSAGAAVDVPVPLIVAVPVLLAALVSLLAPVVTVTVDDTAEVGVPETGQEIEAPAATVAGGTGEQAPSVSPDGKPLTLQVALVAEVVAEALFVHLIVPE